MSDLKLAWDDGQHGADLVYEADDFTLTDDLETAVVLSLFTHAGEWWGDALADVAGDTFGSKLYELARAKNTPAVVARAEQIAREALAWMVEDQVAARVDATAQALTPSVLALTISIVRPTGAASFRYQYNWQSQELAHGV